ncbi:hypothetical protein B0J17DRAFT_717519 [Rhizoctonia solani]|nr:hypothetical protein B0J17DRAFT_717519 [Rhizoctonia solani]
MQFSILSIALAVLAAAPHALAAPAPNGIVPSADPPVGGGLRNVTATYDANHDLPEEKVREPLVERSLEARQQYNAKGWYWGDRRAPCRGKDATYEDSIELVVGLSFDQMGGGKNCGREVRVENQGVEVTAKVVGVKCKNNDLGLSRAMMARFSRGQPEKVNIKWSLYNPGNQRLLTETGKLRTETLHLAVDDDGRLKPVPKAHPKLLQLEVMNVRRNQCIAIVSYGY